MQATVTEEQIATMGEELSKIASQPAFLEQLLKIRTAPASERYDAAKKVATVDNLNAKGVPLTSDFRVSTRSFEEPALVSSDGQSTVYFEDDHGFFEDEDCVITVFADDVLKDGQPEPEEKVRSDISASIIEIGAFVTTASFRSLLEQIYGIPKEQRPEFVRQNVLNSSYLANLGITIPKDMKLQRSHFDDNRPTLFCVTKYLKHAYPWHKVTITFDSET